MTRTRIKICGLTREEDVRAAIDAGADAVGFVFYPPSSRYVSVETAARLAKLLPPFVTAVGLFVAPEPNFFVEVVSRVPLQLIQFHGDESDDTCRALCAPHNLAWIKAIRMRQGVDLLESSDSHPGSRGLLVDAFVDGFGGAGETFDWLLLPQAFERPLVLSGGLHPDNVGDAVRRLRPFAVDVSSGVESAKGIKDAALIAAFVAGVRDVEG